MSVPVYVRPKDILHPTVCMGFTFMRTLSLLCGHCGAHVIGFSWNGRLACRRCDAINVPKWRVYM